LVILWQTAYSLVAGALGTAPAGRADYSPRCRRTPSTAVRPARWARERGCGPQGRQCGRRSASVTSDNRPAVASLSSVTARCTRSDVVHPRPARPSLSSAHGTICLTRAGVGL